MVRPKFFEEKEFLPVMQAARELSVSASTVRRWCAEGHLECIVHPVNHYRFISRDSVDSIKAGFQPGPSAPSS